MTLQSLQQSAAQRKSILKAVFSGQLVSRKPNDKLASVSLERSRADWAARACKPNSLRRMPQRQTMGRM